jgi:hypothetical protein
MRVSPGRTWLHLILLSCAAAITGIGFAGRMTGLIISGIACAGGVAVLIVYDRIRPELYLLEVTCVDEYSEREVMAEIILSTAKHAVVSRCVGSGAVVLCIEIKFVDFSSDLFSRISSLHGVVEARLSKRGETSAKDGMNQTS